MNQQQAIVERPWFRCLALVIVFGALLWLRFPSINAQLPYFTQEDEAHHFNRVVRMVQNGKWDPE